MKIVKWIASNWRSILVSACAFGLIGIRMLKPDLVFDWMSFWLFVIGSIALLQPNIFEFIKTIKFEFGNLKVIIEKEIKEMDSRLAEIESPESEAKREQIQSLLVPSNEAQY